MRRILLCFSFFLTANSIWALNVDSLIQAASKARGSEQEARIQAAIKALSESDSADFLRHKESIEALIEDSRLPSSLSDDLMYETAKWYSNNDMEAEAIEMLLSMLDRLRLNQIDLEMQSRILLRLSGIYYDLGSLDKSLKVSLEGLEVTKQSLDSVRLMKLYNMIGENYRAREEYNQAIIYYDLGTAYAVHLSDTMMRLRLLNNKGIALAQLNRFEEGRQTLDEGYALALAIEHLFSQAVLLTNHGFLEKRSDNYDLAIEYYQRSLTLKQMLGNKASIAYTLNDIGECYFFKNQYKESIEFSKKALKLAREARALYYIKDISKTLSTTYAASGNFDSAYAYQIRFQSLNDSILNANSYQEIARLEKLSELRSQKLENDLLKSENDKATTELSRQRWIMVLVGVISLALLIIGLIVWRVSITRKALMETLEKQNQALEIEHQKMSALLNEQESLFNIVVHDIRSPLSNTRKLLEFEEDASSEDRGKLRAMITQSVDSALNFISDFNILHKFEKSDNLPPKEDIDLTALIKEVLLQFDADLREKEIEVQFNDSESVALHSIRAYIKHILLNLLSNAVKYAPKKSIVFITITQTDSTRISIEDRGPGIAPEEHERIFERFYRAPNALRDSNSNGLGLPLVRLLSEKLGGRVRVKSALGKGAEFIVQIP